MSGLTSTRNLTEMALAVFLTISIGGIVEVREYPNCYTIHVGSEYLVFAYQDGPGAPPRARWKDSLVLAVEHAGGHQEQEAWHNAHKPLQRPVQPPARPVPAMPHGQMTEPFPNLPKMPITGGQPVTVMPLETQPEEIDRKTEAFLNKHADSSDFFSGDGSNPPGAPAASSTAESAETSEIPAATYPHITEEDLKEVGNWSPPADEDGEAVEPEQPKDGSYKPKSRSTPHRDVQKSTLKRSRGTAKNGLKAAGTALLLGFALLGFSPNI